MQTKYLLKNCKDQKEDYSLNYVNMKQEMIFLKLLQIKFFILTEGFTDKKLHRI